MSGTASCGTSSADPAPAGGGQFGGSVSDAAAAFVPSHLVEGMVLHGGPDVAVTGNPTTIDTDRLTIDGATSPWFVLRNGYAALFANRVVFDHDVVITGPRPLIVAAEGDVTVTASIDLSAHGPAPGAGAATFGAGEGGPGDTYIIPGGPVRVSSGGGGGGHGSPGAPGGGNDELIRAGVGGMVYGAQLSDRLLGGAPGGAGGLGGTTGGAGGGALQISSATSISITGPHIAAGGGGGEGGGGSTSGGAGGGAGGQLFLEAPVLTIASTLAANGGGGGGGGGEGGIEGGTDGADGLIGDAPASGGVAGVPMGSDGGAGAAGTAASFVGAQPGGGGNAVAGGGGGGAGRIWLRYQKHRGLVTTGAVISPPATLDPTLP